MRQRLPLIILFAILFIGMLAGLVLSSKLDISSFSRADNSPEVNFTSTAPSDLNQIDNSGKAFSKIANQVKPVVVTIISEKKVKVGGGFDDIFRKFHKDMPDQGLGSGVIVHSDGYILTNHHVINEADQITVRLVDKRVFRAELLGSDPLTDIALIKIDAEKLPVASFGNSDLIEVGEWVLAIGSPLSLNSTVTAGIVSAIGRQIDIIGDQYGVESFIQTDAVINPGNSGGALVNIKGELIGINTAIASKTGLYQGYGFAVPSNIAKHVMEDIIKYGYTVRGYVGVGIKDVDATYAKAVGLKNAEGVLVESLMDKGAAKESGLEEGDVILKIDGRNLNQSNDLQAYVALKQPGDVVQLLIQRNGSQITKSVTLKSVDGSTSPPPAQSRKNTNKEKEDEIGSGMGFEVEEISDNVPRGKGVIVTNSSWHAKEQSIYEGFFITKVNDKPISTMEDYRAAIKNLKNGDAVIVHLMTSRRENKIITAIEVKKKN
ncbi:trypsin-like peptidase domain-containing protein [bacterium]|nr:trypsin-like peptidase domain-containing protein [bacterium]